MSATRRTLLAAALCTAFAAAAPLAQAADAPITIMVGGINKIIYLPAKLTEALGYFKEEGLNVELQSQPAGVDAENQLIAGAVQGVVGFYDHTIDLQSKGKDIQACRVLQGAGRGGNGLDQGRAAGFKSMADAKGGKTLGVTGPGLVHRLPHALPGRPRGCGLQGVLAAARGRRQHLHRRHQAGPHPGRHDHRADRVAVAQDRRRQGAGRPAHSRPTPSRRWAASTPPPASTCRTPGPSRTRPRPASWRTPSRAPWPTSTRTAPRRSPRRCRATTTATTRSCTSRR
jgi:hypothetical protein